MTRREATFIWGGFRMSGAMRIVGLSVVAVILLLTGVVGIVESVDDIPNADSLGKMVYVILLAAFGCLGLGAGAAVLTRKPWAKVFILGWAVTVLATVLVSPFVWPWPGMVPTVGATGVTILLTGLTYSLWKAAASGRPGPGESRSRNLTNL